MNLTQAHFSPHNNTPIGMCRYRKFRSIFRKLSCKFLKIFGLFFPNGYTANQNCKFHFLNNSHNHCCFDENEGPDSIFQHKVVGPKRNIQLPKPQVRSAALTKNLQMQWFFFHHKASVKKQPDNCQEKGNQSQGS